MELSIIEVLYIIFLIGSLAFGLEAMLIGLGGKLMIVYRHSILRTLALALSVGLATVFLAVATSMVLRLEPIYFVALVLVYVFIAGRLIKIWGAKFVGTTPPPQLPQTSEKEIKEIVRRRGYGKFLIKKRKRRASTR